MISHVHSPLLFSFFKINNFTLMCRKFIHNKLLLIFSFASSHLFGDHSTQPILIKIKNKEDFFGVTDVHFKFVWFKFWLDLPHRARAPTRARNKKSSPVIYLFLQNYEGEGRVIAKHNKGRNHIFLADSFKKVVFYV